MLLAVADLIADRAEELTRLEPLDVGKPLHEARVDVDHAERLFRFYGEGADKLPNEKLTVDGGFAFTDRIPHGVTGHITPWNYPIQLFARTVAPALAVGNAWLSPDADDAFCGACHHPSGGDPFLLSELLVELAADRGFDAPGETARVRDVAPATVKRSVHLRIGRLPKLASRLARAVAVLGDGAELREAAALGAVDTAVAAEAADALAAVSILEPGRPLRFVHPLVRNAIYADLPAAAKAAAHHRAAKLLQDRRAGPGRIAIHLLATHPDADPEVVATLDAAARRVARPGPASQASRLRPP
jgi:hypothetical protein